MTRRTSVALASAAALASLSLAACASAPPTASKPAGAAPPSLPQSPTMPAAEPAAIPSGPPLDLHDVHWPSASIPGQFCSIPAPVKLKGGYATASSVRWGHVLLYAGPQITYGNLGGNAGEVAAMEVMCSNGGGTADGQLADSYIIFTGAGRKVTAIGAVTPQEQAPGVHITLVNGITITPGVITVKERWYRQNDGTCCATGRASTVWAYANGRFTPGTPDITA